jgi:hypothetical protein
VRQRRVLKVGDDLLDDGVVAVGGLGIEHRLRVVGEYCVVAVDGEQLVLFTAAAVGLRRRTRRTISRAVMCCVWRRLVNAVKGTSVTSASEIPRCSSWS